MRGELLKKYPNTVIFAQHAKMVNGVRAPDWLTPAEEAPASAHRRRAPRCTRLSPRMTFSSSASI